MTWRERLLAVLYPEGVTCLGCGAASHGAYLCPACEADMRGQRLSEPMADGTCSVWRHVGAPRQLVLRLKHGGVLCAADLLAEGMVEAARAMALPPDIVVTWVSMPRLRRRKRGIDHGQELARRVAAGLDAPCRQLMIRQKGLRHTQEGLSRARRQENLWDAFVSLPLEGESVLLVDDVHTTGATAYVCTRALKEAGAGRVHVLTATAVPDAKKRGNHP